MGADTKIQWADYTLNPWIGCTKVGPGCDHCYAERYGKRFGIAWGPRQPRKRTSDANWREPLRWNAQPYTECIGCGWRGPQSKTGLIACPPGFDRNPGLVRVCPSCSEPLIKESRARVFCASLADVFDNEVPPQWRGELWALVKATPHLNWLILTKRVGNAIGMAPAEGLPANVWLGATVVNQEEADRDIPKLLATPAAVRFLSIEPILGEINLDAHYRNGAFSDRERISLVIVGGESGPSARPTVIEHIRSIVVQSRLYGFKVFVKQLGSQPLRAGEHGWHFDHSKRKIVDSEFRTMSLRDPKGGDPDEWPEDLRIREFPA